MIVILRQQYLELVEAHQSMVAGLKRTVCFCAAKLIEYFRHWREWKLSTHRTEWIYMPMKCIHQDLMGEHSLHVIRAAIWLLEQLGILEKRHNPNGQDKTWQYRFKLDVLQTLLNSERGTFRSEQAEFNAEQHTQDQHSRILDTTTACVEETSEEVRTVIADAPFIRHVSEGLFAEESFPRAAFSGGIIPDVICLKKPCGIIPDVNAVQPGDESESAICKETIVEDDFSATLGDDEFKCEFGGGIIPPPTRAKSASNFNSSKSIKIPFLEELKLNRVEVGSQELIWIAKKFPDRLHSAVAAWLQWAKTEKVEKPTRSLIAAIKNNWQPKLTPREAWWQDAAIAWGRERRDRLLDGVVDGWIYFKNKQRLALDKAVGMSWDELAQLGGEV